MFMGIVSKKDWKVMVLAGKGCISLCQAEYISLCIFFHTSCKGTRN